MSLRGVLLLKDAVAIRLAAELTDCFASLAMTHKIKRDGRNDRGMARNDSEVLLNNLGGAIADTQISVL